MAAAVSLEEAISYVTITEAVLGAVENQRELMTAAAR